MDRFRQNRFQTAGPLHKKTFGQNRSNFENARGQRPTLYGLPKVGLAVGLASGSGSLNGTILFFIYCSYFPICEIDCS